MKTCVIACCALAWLPLSGPAWPAGANAFIDRLEAPAASAAMPGSLPLLAIAQAGPRVVTAGLRGHILYSDDAGGHWRQARVPVQSDLTALSFPTPLEGWAVGHDGVVLHTRDGASTWQVQLDGVQAARILMQAYQEKYPQHSTNGEHWLAVARQFQDEGADKPFLDVWFKNPQVGYIVGAFGLAFETLDGGVHWQPLLDKLDNPDGLHLYAVRGYDQSVYMAGEAGALFRLEGEGGQAKLTRLDVGTDTSLFGLYSTGQALYAYGLQGVLLKTVDGQHWTRITSSTSASVIAATEDAAHAPLLLSQSGQLLSIDPVTNLAHLQPLASANAVLRQGDQLLTVGDRGVQVHPIPLATAGMTP